MDVFVVVLVGCFGKERNSGSARFHQQWPLFCSQLLYYSYSLLHRFLSQIDTLFPSPYCTTIGLEVQNGYGLIETSPCVAGRQPYYNVYNSLFRSVFEIYRYGSVCFFLVAFSETDFRSLVKLIVKGNYLILNAAFKIFLDYLAVEFKSGYLQAPMLLN
ncbi:uncharacterized protein [Gossypium hirsutum]|uniref:Uncharacterized protein isoform X2 n=1 Tax=Gossypium hirsutum TaxID=3635 RepID=A0ABM3AYA9_GOSHI|nr:uncharacterized protein LOC107942345 isoform X2 [Gossypium hirsutum]